MIDVNTEKLIPITDVPKIVPSSRGGGTRLNIATVWRWITRGNRGGIKLEITRIGGSVFTSREAIQRFANALNDDASPVKTPTPLTRTTKCRTRDIARANAKCEAAGI